MLFHWSYCVLLNCHFLSAIRLLSTFQGNLQSPFTLLITSNIRLEVSPEYWSLSVMLHSVISNKTTVLIITSVTNLNFKLYIVWICCSVLFTLKIGVWKNISNNICRPHWYFTTLCAILKGKLDLSLNEALGSEGCVRRAECILNFGAGWKVVVTNMFWPLHPGRALWYILGGLMSPTVDWVALQENVFTLIGSTFFVQLFIFSKSMYLQLIFMYSSGIIFKKRKSVQQLST